MGCKPTGCKSRCSLFSVSSQFLCPFCWFLMIPDDSWFLRRIYMVLDGVTSFSFCGRIVADRRLTITFLDALFSGKPIWTRDYIWQAPSCGLSDLNASDNQRLKGATKKHGNPSTHRAIDEKELLSKHQMFASASASMHHVNVYQRLRGYTCRSHCLSHSCAKKRTRWSFQNPIVEIQWRPLPGAGSSKPGRHGVYVQLWGSNLINRSWNQLIKQIKR